MRYYPGIVIAKLWLGFASINRKSSKKHHRAGAVVSGLR
jgi:hypothetical protein